MHKNTSQRHWLSPVVAIAFIIAAVTGVMLFTGAHLPYMKALHQWSGFLLLAAGLWHLLLNWKPFCLYLRRPAAVAAIAGAAVLCLVLAGVDAALGHHDGGGQHHRGHDWQSTAEATDAS